MEIVSQLGITSALFSAGEIRAKKRVFSGKLSHLVHVYKGMSLIPLGLLNFSFASTKYHIFS